MAKSVSDSEVHEGAAQPAALGRASGPEVSVVVPCYNRKDMVAKAVNSALAQTMGSIEVIVVDDGSTDGVGSTLAEIKDVRLKVVHLGRNTGGAHARNVGIENATGKYIALLDSDDWWHPTKLANQLDLTKNLDVQGNWVIYNKIEQK